MVEDTVFIRGKVFMDRAAFRASDLRDDGRFVAVGAVVFIATEQQIDAVDDKEWDEQKIENDQEGQEHNGEDGCPE